MSPSPLIIAHRGASAHEPENTIAAFRSAIDVGAHGIEFDVRLAKDGVPVVIHDSKLRRTTKRHGRVSEYPSTELGKTDAGSWFQDKYPKRPKAHITNEGIPTLAQVLKMLEGYCGFIYIEVKPTKSDLYELVDAVCDVVRSSPVLPRVIIKSFKLAVLPEVRGSLPGVQTAALFGPNMKNLLRRRSNIITIAREFRADQLSLHYSLITRKLVRRATDERMPITIWTTDKIKWVERSRRLGIKALITNDPCKLLEAQRSR